MVQYYKGKYKLKNPQKYRGNPTNVIYRSLWERQVMKFLDEQEAILEWASEELVIPYVSPLDNKRHRYFPDFYMKFLNSKGEIKEMIIEVKPAAQTKEPSKSTKKPTKKYITEVATWGVNQAKWNAAKEYCKTRGWEFQVLTEAELFGKKGKK